MGRVSRSYVAATTVKEMGRATLKEMGRVSRSYLAATTVGPLQQRLPHQFLSVLPY